MKIDNPLAGHTKRRRLLAATALMLVSSALPALADTYPSKPIRMIVPYLAGGVTDVMARQFATVMSDKLGQQIVVDNKPGANTLIATQAAATAPPDGYTIFFMDLSLLSYNAYLYKQQPYELTRDFVPVTSVAEIPLGLAVNNFVPANNVKEFIAYAKANPGKMNYSSTASGGLPHLAMENLKSVAGIEMTHVPYKGAAAAITDMIGGQIDMFFATASPLVPQVQQGQLRVLALTGSQRSPILPDVPTFKELGIDMTMTQWYGLAAPAGTPPEVVKALSDSLSRALKDPSVQNAIRKDAAMERDLPMDQFKQYIIQDIANYRKAATPDLLKQIGQ